MTVLLRTALIFVLGLLPSHFASAQTATANRVGVSDARYFARVCMETAPSFAEAVSEDAQMRDAESILPTRGPFQYWLRVEHKDGECVCEMIFSTTQSRIDDRVANARYVMLTEYHDEHRPVADAPRDMAFNIDGADVDYRIFVAEAEGSQFFVGLQAARAGECVS